MAENMAPENVPTAELDTVYKAWGNGGWGSILTGELDTLQTLPYDTDHDRQCPT